MYRLPAACSLFGAIEAARSLLFDTSSWGPFCDITLTLKQARQSDNGAWVKLMTIRADKLFGTS